ncbi:hypothetical protein [Flavobacterium sp. 140616W15]|uniref:hypothetical protein n=1 Tax=Flavobacterium sp. 140616W15 TaxID=2478552 RepID=UPI000F0C9B35|nr:hypothetical protein [Flavobacterium sp. 140616W15]AYN05575.1 hypothetical protein EAG11_16525 [Flavobacterium sp. 140616W15]
MGILDRLCGKSISKNPEEEYIIPITDESIKVEHPDRETETILWKDIESIKLINTDNGPFAPDVWLALIDKNTGCLIPQRTKGFETVYAIVSEYENFNFENFIESISCTDNGEFLLWKKEE